MADSGYYSETAIEQVENNDGPTAYAAVSKQKHGWTVADLEQHNDPPLPSDDADTTEKMRYRIGTKEGKAKYKLRKGDGFLRKKMITRSSTAITASIRRMQTCRCFSKRTGNDMRTRSMTVLMLLILAGIGSGCGKGWEMDYGKPAAQFLQADLATKGQAFIGKKITVKGTVTKVDVSTPDAARVYLEGGIQCDLGKFKAMAERCKIGETVYVDGFLERCEEGDILIDPAMLRDPTAPYSPKQ